MRLKRTAAILLLAILLAGCSSGVSSTDNIVSPSAARYEETVISKDHKLVESSMVQVAENPSSGDTGSQDERKVVKKSSVEMSVADFEAAVAEFKAITSESGGYTEDYSYKTAVSGKKEYRYGSITLRVPSDKYDSVLEQIKGVGKIAAVSSSESDETERFYDTERRMELKQAEETQLLEMIEKASKIEDLIALEERLSSVRADIESYKSDLLGIDRLVEYSTIYIYLTENPEEIFEPVSDDLGERVKQSFFASFNGVVGFFEAVLVLAARLLLPIAVLAVPIAAGILIYRKVSKKRHGRVKNDKD